MDEALWGNVSRAPWFLARRRRGAGLEVQWVGTAKRLRYKTPGHDQHCPSGYDLEIVDIYQQPEVVASRGVLAVPTLIKELPLSARVLIGDLTDEARVLAALGLSTATQE
jgi:hypothetical protein